MVLNIYLELTTGRRGVTPIATVAYRFATREARDPSTEPGLALPAQMPYHRG